MLPHIPLSCSAVAGSGKEIWAHFLHRLQSRCIALLSFLETTAGEGDKRKGKWWGGCTFLIEPIAPVCTNDGKIFALDVFFFNLFLFSVLWPHSAFLSTLNPDTHSQMLFMFLQCLFPVSVAVSVCPLDVCCDVKFQSIIQYLQKISILQWPKQLCYFLFFHYFLCLVVALVVLTIYG